MDLDSMKYADLRQLAKSVGLKANVKAEKLINALKQHFEHQESTENGNTVSSNDVQIPVEAAAEPKPAIDALVTTRRGKKQQAKRKCSGEQADPNPRPEQGPVQHDPAAAPQEDERGSKKSSKRRKVSSGPQSSEEGGSADDDADTEASNKDLPKKPAGKIPRHEGLLKKKAALRPTTPNFKKLHEAHFNRMESIDLYLQRRTKQMEALRDSVKDLKAQTGNAIAKSANTKTRAKAAVSRASLFSPEGQEKKGKKCRVTETSACKRVLKDSAPFRPSILAANKINVRFSQATQDNEHKRSLVKTPARMSPMLPLTPTPGRESEVHNKSSAPVNKTPGLTPFVFSGASGTPGTNRKNAFNLKASLSRPLTYKPHKGKLKPFGTVQETATLNKSQTLPSHQKNYKQHQVQTRDERRVKHREDRKQKKKTMIGARRGLVIG